METKNLEEMTREELVELVYSLNKEIEGLQKDLDVYKGWKIERGCSHIGREEISSRKSFL